MCHGWQLSTYSCSRCHPLIVPLLHASVKQPYAWQNYHLTVLSHAHAALSSTSKQHKLLTAWQPAKSQANVCAGSGGVALLGAMGKPVATDMTTGEGFGCRLGGGAGAIPTLLLCPTMTRGFTSSPTECEGGAAGEDATEDRSASMARSACLCSAIVI